MRGIRSKGTGPEEKVRTGLHRRGFRFGRNPKRHGLTFKPDIILPIYKTAILVHGCFWHRHIGCKLAYDVKIESTIDRVKWAKKFDANIQRDKRDIAAILKLGWRALVIWECQTRKEATLDSCLDEAADWIRNGNTYIEFPRKSSANKQ